MPKIKNLKPFSKLDTKATYLVLISPQEIPHLVIVHQGNYYTLTHKKKVLGESFQNYFNLLKRAEKKMIFLELVAVENLPINAFNKYEKANDKITCLSPVKDCLIPQSKAEFVYQLIPDLYAAAKIKNALFLNLEKDLTELGDFNLSEYSKEAIFSYIQTLNEKHAKRR